MSYIYRQIETSISPVLRRSGYRKKGKTWSRVTDDSILELNLQKSQWGDQFFMNLWITLKNVREDFSNQITGRADDIIQGDNVLDKLLDFEDVSDEARSKKIDELNKLLSNQILPFLDSFSTLEGAKTRVKELKGFLVSPKLRKYLDQGS